MRFVILHYHFLKNAGMTVMDLLHSSFGAGYGTIDTPDHDGHVSTEALLALLEGNTLLKAISSHQIRYPLPQVRGFLFFDVCFLRDPVDRLRSTYDYFREKPAAADPVSEFANRLPLGEFIATLVREMPWYVGDAQVNLLANGIANDLPTAQDFDRAVAQMMRTSLLGVVDRVPESMAAGRHFLRSVFPELDDGRAVAVGGANVIAKNVTGGLEATLEARRDRVRDACDPSVYSELLQLNELDSKLLDLARAEVERRFRRTRASAAAADEQG
jgi:hypothetical protein